ncbi:MAG: hypothetical protein PHE29_12320 [Tissierellia bacterium]|nr:hypothetical protein [Tissierellia bacterium]MDD4780950.1 hypothetical protein [Tissierellia bacterium]
MNKFIYCLDEDLKNKLIKQGFKLLKEDDKGATFVFSDKIKFDFNNVSKNKFMFTNRLTF